MADNSVPYLMAYGNITRVLERIQEAQVPPRFSQDFLDTTLRLSGGGARPLIPFLKRTGFLAGDGTPTDRYRRFRNKSNSGAAAAEALKMGYAPLYAVNEYLHDASDAAFKGVIVQVTGSEPNSSTVGAIVGSFKALKAFAKFDAETAADAAPAQDDVAPTAIREPSVAATASDVAIRLGYTINLNLPATTDIAVFDAIFKSLRENLL